MSDFKPENFEPIQNVIQRVRQSKMPTRRNKYCRQIETRFEYQDWETQLDIYELWLDIDNDYTRTCLYVKLNNKYWGLLQQLVRRGVKRAESLSARIMEHSIQHMRTQIIALFVAENAPIETVRKYKKQLERYLNGAYSSLAYRIGGDKDFVIDKDRLICRLEYFDICVKCNKSTTDEEAIEELKIHFKRYADIGGIWCDTIDKYDSIRDVQFSLRLDQSINNWRETIGTLGLIRAVNAFDRWDADLRCRYNIYYEADISKRFCPTLTDCWDYFIEMACNDLFSDLSPADYLNIWEGRNPAFDHFVKDLDLKLFKPLELT